MFIAYFRRNLNSKLWFWLISTHGTWHMHWPSSWRGLWVVCVLWLDCGSWQGPFASVPVPLLSQPTNIWVWNRWMKKSYWESHIETRVFTNKTADAVFIRETAGCCCVHQRDRWCCFVHQRDRWMLLFSSERQVDALVLTRSRNRG